MSVTEQNNEQNGVRLTPEPAKSRRARNIAIALIVAALVVIFYAITIVKLGPNVLLKPN